MFHFVVETDKVALQCTKLLQQHKAGRVTFMPLNTLNPPPVRGPLLEEGRRRRKSIVFPCPVYCFGTFGGGVEDTWLEMGLGNDGLVYEVMGLACCLAHSGTMVGIFLV